MLSFLFFLLNCLEVGMAPEAGILNYIIPRG